MKSVLVLGATGSIGTTFLNAAKNNHDIHICGLTAEKNPSLTVLGKEFKAPYIYLKGSDSSKLDEFITRVRPDIVLNAISGCDGLTASWTVLDKGIDLALANKESIVLGGELLLEKARNTGAEIIPVDSEHSAIWHLLKGRKAERLIITASGGPFRTRHDLSSVTIEEALRHPTWKMGRKITIDSATLANKGLEVMEAAILFSFPSERIDVSIHPESIVHSLIETEEGAYYALLSTPDMTLPIMTAILGEGNRLKNIVRPLPFSAGFSLHFESWDKERFPMLQLAYDALRKGRSYRIAYASSDEAAVDAFLDGRISFTDIPKVVSSVLSHDYDDADTIDEILSLREMTKKEAEDLC